MSEMAPPHYTRIRQTLSGKSAQPYCTLPTHPDNESMRNFYPAYWGKQRLQLYVVKNWLEGVANE